jgi:hypothetical protein
MEQRPQGDEHQNTHLQANVLSGELIPSTVPGVNLQPEDLAQVDEEDVRVLRAYAHSYCRKIDAARSRKRTDGSATVVRDGRVLYGTDDVADDVAQDATLIYANRLAHVRATCEPTASEDETSEVLAWKYTRKDGTQILVTRDTIRRWAVRDAAGRNGYRQPQETEPAPVAQATGQLALATTLAGQHEALWRLAFGDGKDFPTLRELLPRAEQAADLKRAGVLTHTAMALYGGVYNSSGNVRKVKDAALREWRELSARLDEVRQDYVHQGNEQRGGRRRYTPRNSNMRTGDEYGTTTARR